MLSGWRFASLFLALSFGPACPHWFGFGFLCFGAFLPPERGVFVWFVVCLVLDDGLDGSCVIPLSVFFFWFEIPLHLGCYGSAYFSRVLFLSF